jgi:hypothetical protein
MGMPEKIFVVPRGEKWAVRREGEPTDASTHVSRREAIELGKSLSASGECELVVHDIDRRCRPREEERRAATVAGL